MISKYSAKPSSVEKSTVHIRNNTAQLCSWKIFHPAYLADQSRAEFIGLNHDQRKKNLHLIINNARFLILPWIQSTSLASMILSKAAKRVPDDWREQYNYRPVVLETFVEKPRFQETCYKTANWQYLGHGRIFTHATVFLCSYGAQR